MDELTIDVKQYAQETLGAWLVGVASVDRFVEAPRGHRPDELLPGAQAVVVVALPLLEPLMNWRGILKNSEAIPEMLEVGQGEMFELRTASQLPLLIHRIREVKAKPTLLGNSCLLTNLQKVLLRCNQRRTSADSHVHSVLFGESGL